MFLESLFLSDVTQQQRLFTRLNWERTVGRDEASGIQSAPSISELHKRAAVVLFACVCCLMVLVSCVISSLEPRALIICALHGLDW
jgi:hypothetical protein